MVTCECYTESNTPCLLYNNTQVGDILLEVGVDPDTPNVPVILVEESHMEKVLSIFYDFNPATPPARDFEIPRECMQASAGKATPTRALRAGRLRSGRL